MKTREELYAAGHALTLRFCAHNQIQFPGIQRILSADRLYQVGSCAFYRPYTIHIMVEKCAQRGFGGRAWSWPGYVIDRTPYGVMQHELGHHVDTLRTGAVTQSDLMDRLFSRQIFLKSREPALTGYLGTDQKAATFFMEWFAEHFRLFVTNPDLLRKLRPKCYDAMIAAGLKPAIPWSWESTLRSNLAPDRIKDQARKKIENL